MRRKPQPCSLKCVLVRRTGRIAAVIATVSAIVFGNLNPAAAEGSIRIAEQFGVGYLPLQIMRQKGLIEAEGKKTGVDITVEWMRFSGGAAMNDALVSDHIDIGSGGIGPLLSIWDRTKGSMNVMGIAALNSMPLFLNTNNPEVQKLEDFTAKDKIALPAVDISVQARTLQMAAEQVFGEGNHEKLDGLTVTMSHLDATVAILSGSEITGHLTSPPYQYQQLEIANIRKVLSSYDVLGGPHTFNSVWAKASFRANNPKTFAAFLNALKGAMMIIETDPKGAATAYVDEGASKLDPAFIERIITDPEIRFTIVPENTMKYANFMHKVNAINNRPVSWRDFYFENIHDQPGS